MLKIATVPFRLWTDPFSAWAETDGLFDQTVDDPGVALQASAISVTGRATGVAVVTGRVADVTAGGTPGLVPIEPAPTTVTFAGSPQTFASGGAAGVTVAVAAGLVPIEPAPTTVTSVGSPQTFASGGAAGVTVAVANGLALTAPAPTTVTSVGSPLTFVLDWDASVAGAPAGFMTDVVAAARWLASQFVDAVTITLNVGYNEIAGSQFGGAALGESLSDMVRESYTALTGAVASHARTTTDTSVVASLPSIAPIGGRNYWVTRAQGKALGLVSANSTAVDGSIGFGLASRFTYGDGAASGSVASGTYDFFGTAVHEMTEVMGRQLLTGATELSVPNSYSLFDLLHYSAPGSRDFSASVAGYFSPDGGVTNLGAFSTVSGSDAGDWASSVTGDAFDAFAQPSTIQAVSANDLTVLDAIGWQPAASGVVPDPSSIGVAATIQSRSLASAQVNKGLAANAPLFSIAQTGGPSGDTYVFAVGGADAASFNLTAAGNAATLAVGASAISGSRSGGLYALTVTATDATAGTSSSATPLNVVLGDNGNDILRVLSIAGIVSSAPTFIYALGGDDAIDATGMTGTVYLDGGSGADRMTGGAGANVYLYGGAADSTGSVMDVVTNFNVTMDLIDLTGLNTPFGAVGALAPAATGIAPGTIGWQVGKGNTFVYANTSNRTEALTAANMKIELLGSLALSASNFSHV